MAQTQLDLFNVFDAPIAEEKIDAPVVATKVVEPQPLLAKPKEIEIEDKDLVVKDIAPIAKLPKNIVVKPTVIYNNTPKEDKPKSTRGRKSTATKFATINLVSVPSDAELKQKLYYSITQVAKWFNVTASQIRFWENEFDILKPRKNKKGDRLFRPEDIKNLKQIYTLIRNKKYTVEGAKEYLKQQSIKGTDNVDVENSLLKIKQFLIDLKSDLS
jgi:DNA-binding transcriptional MerR regulator